METIGLYIIVKDEAKQLRDCLKSVKDAKFDEIHVCQTVENEDVKSVIESFPNVTRHFRAWTNSFSEAKNYVMDKCTTDWVMYIDSDDVLSNPKKLRKLIAKAGDANCISLIYNYSEGQSYFKERIVRRGTHRWKYHVHETLEWTGEIKKKFYTAVQINHHPVAQGKLSRNKDLCELDYQEYHDARSCYYMGISYYDLGDYMLSIPFFKEYLAFAINDEERYLGQLQYAKALGEAGMYGEALDNIYEAHTHFPTYNMALVLSAKIYSYIGNYYMAIDILEKVFKEGVKIPKKYPIYQKEYNEDAIRVYKECMGKKNLGELLCRNTASPVQTAGAI